MSDATLQAYNKSAKLFADYFRGIRPRAKYVDLVFQLAHKTDDTADVLELGCGDGRDARYIVPRARSYTGIDYSGELIKLAQEHVPEADFRHVSMQEFDYPAGAYDIIFAFASVLHLTKEELGLLLKSAAKSLKDGGILYISTKYQKDYGSRWQEDRFGTRLFYFYNEEMIRQLAGNQYEVVHSERETLNKTEWLEIALRKI